MDNSIAHARDDISFDDTIPHWHDINKVLERDLTGGVAIEAKELGGNFCRLLGAFCGGKG